MTCIKSYTSAFKVKIYNKFVTILLLLILMHPIKTPKLFIYKYLRLL